MKVFLASTNLGKLLEFRALFKGVAGFCLEAPPCPIEVEETGVTFLENARIKAEACCLALGESCLADDSGLAVDALGGRPGIYSARYAKTDPERIAKLLLELEGLPHAQRGAAFICAIALARPNQRTLCVEGRLEGFITQAPRGQKGFGYDPVFYVPETKLTFAEMNPEEKNRISHRGVAVEALKTVLNRK
jgi:XTP/dITP diphosphohydrolase